MKILLLIAAWQRHETARITYQQLMQVETEWNNLGITLIPLVICSNSEDAALANSFGFITYYHKNSPLGEKMNAGLKRALEFKCDYIMQLGSDDLLDANLINFYLDPLLRKSPFFGLSSLYFYDQQGDRLKELQLTNVIGAGRCIRRDICEFMSENFGLWYYRTEKGLDNDSEARIYDFMGFEQHRVQYIKTPTPMILDIKDGENLHSFDDWGSANGEQQRMIEGGEKAGVLRRFGMNKGE